MLFFTRSRASVLLPGVLLCVILAGVGASMPANKCPNHIDCARMGRHFCKPSSSHCGPCLFPLEEDKMGHCVARRRRNPQQHLYDSSPPEVDEEIDYLSSVIAKQQISEVKQSGSDSQSSSQSRSQSRPNGLSPNTTVEPTTSSPSTHKTPKPPKPLTDSSQRHGPIISPHSSKDSLLVSSHNFSFHCVRVCFNGSSDDLFVHYCGNYGSHPRCCLLGPSGDKSLAHSAQMYHYQHQKQQMLSMEKHKTEPKVSESGATSDEENEEGDFTVYECPGLAPTGEMEVKNPLFDDSTLNSQRNNK
ncbi:Neural proliferation differentiation and control protein 1 [Triplophysa tibetana]|uniref:Neural proliferation differentiation and control protein 1 n=1 Tax=Triplophysa tibetana TaxID=1572043 RepID=A0A5A9PD82_9TELE|nr:Neural proliferation differentiation and control protein 1 [Triplophysa tibetana]